MVNIDANGVDLRGVDVDWTVFKRCGVLEEYSSSTRLFMLVVGAGVLMLKEVVDLLMIMMKGVEGNSGAVGFKLVLVVNVIFSVDGMTEDIEDKR